MSYDSLLMGVPLFSNLRPHDLKQLSRVMKPRQLRENQVVFRAGAPGDAMYVISSGLVKLSLKRDSLDQEEIVLDTLGPGEFFGEMSLLDGEPRSATVTCLSPTTLLRLSREEFLGAVTLHPSIASQVLCRLASHVRQASYYLEHAHAESIDQDFAPDPSQPHITLTPGSVEARAQDELSSPFARMLAVALEQQEHGRAVLRLPWREGWTSDQPGGAVHHGVISALVGLGGQAACRTVVGSPSDQLSPLDLRTDFLRPAPPRDLVCEAQVMSANERTLIARMEVFVEHLPQAERRRPVATGQGIYQILRDKEPT